jgi:hypothetical protein
LKSAQTGRELSRDDLASNKPIYNEKKINKNKAAKLKQEQKQNKHTLQFY